MELRNESDAKIRSMSVQYPSLSVNIGIDAGCRQPNGERKWTEKKERERGGEIINGKRSTQYLFPNCSTRTAHLLLICTSA